MVPTADVDAVLVTGAAGKTAAPIIEALASDGCRVIGLDLAQAPPQPGVHRWISGSILDRSLLADAVPLGGAVVHGAVALDRQDYTQVTPAVQTNVAGTYLVLDAARRRRCSRVVLLSSAPVHRPGRDDAWLSSPGEDHLYDVTKRLQEQIAGDFAETFGLPVTVLRLGHVVDAVAGRDRAGVALADVDYCRGGWVCCHDVGRAVAATLRQREDGLSLYHVVGSPQARDRFDIAATEAALGLRLTPCTPDPGRSARPRG